MFGQDTYVFIQAATKSASFDPMLLIGPLIVAIVSIATLMLTNRNNLRSALEQHGRLMEKEKEQREFDLKKEIYRPIAAAFLEMQQTTAKTVGGEADMAVVMDMLKKIGHTMGAAQLVAKPETYILIQNYYIASAKTLLKEMPRNDELAREKALIEGMPNGKSKGTAYHAFASAMLQRIPHISSLNAGMIRTATPVLVALRNELGIDTSLEEMAAVAEDNVAIGQEFLNDLKASLEIQLKGNP